MTKRSYRYSGYYIEVRFKRSARSTSRERPRSSGHPDQREADKVQFIVNGPGKRA
jgi:hypothetical protein